jgi:hypothetical protein
MEFILYLGVLRYVFITRNFSELSGTEIIELFIYIITLL